MIEYSEDELLTGIRSKDNKVLEFIYQQYYPSVSHLVRNNNGSFFDAEDVFQDSIIILFQKFKDNNQKLQCTVKTYLYSISKNLWMQRLEKKKRTPVDFSDVENYIDMKVEIGKEYIEFEKERLYQKHYLNMSKSCMQLLALVVRKISSEELAKKMGFKTGQYARKRKSQCRKTLLMKIQNDPDYKRLLDHE